MNKTKILLPIAILALLAIAFGLGQQMTTKSPNETGVTDKAAPTIYTAPVLNDISKLEVQLDDNCRPSITMESYSIKKQDPIATEGYIKFFDVTKPLKTYGTTAPQDAYNKAVSILAGKESMIQDSLTNTFDTIQALFSYNDKEPGCNGPLTPFQDVTLDPELKIENVDVYKANLNASGQGTYISYQALAKKGDYMILVEISPTTKRMDTPTILESCYKTFPKSNESIKCFGDEILKTEKAQIYSQIKQGLELLKIK
jgi:hypothetical protein